VVWEGKMKTVTKKGRGTLFKQTGTIDIVKRKNREKI